jgi:hypothetical protein
MSDEHEPRRPVEDQEAENRNDAAQDAADRRAALRWPYGSRITPDESHTCPDAAAGAMIRRVLAEDDREEALYGPAVTRIERVDRLWYAHNDEYSTPIRFCPFCGSALENEAIRAWRADVDAMYERMQTPDFGDAMLRILDEPMRVPVPEHLRRPVEEDEHERSD